MPVALISSSTSPAFGPSISMVSTVSGSPAFQATAARVFMNEISSGGRENRHGPDGLLVFVAQDMKLAAEAFCLTVPAQHRRVEECSLGVCSAAAHRVTETRPMRVAKILRHDKIKFPADCIIRRMANKVAAP